MLCEKDKILSPPKQHMHHGDPGHRTVVRHVLNMACTPLYVMLTQWLLDGTLEDPHHEFFIASDHTVSDDKLWQDKYSIRWAEFEWWILVLFTFLFLFLFLLLFTLKYSFVMARLVIMI